MNVSRRHAITSVAALVAGGSAGLSHPAFGQSGQVVVGTWGGDGAETLRRAVDEPLRKRSGLEVLQEIALGESRLTKMLVEKNSRRGSFDVAHLADAEKFLAASQGLLETFPEGRIPRKSKVIARLQEPDAIPFVYTYRAIIYNDKRLSTPPRSYADLWDPSLKGKIGVADVFYHAIIESAAIAGGGGIHDFEPAKKMLLEWKRMGTRVYPSREAIAAALKSEEILVNVDLASRAVFWRRAGLPVKFALPKEGGTLQVFNAAIPRNARNKDAAYAYLDAMLQPEAQTGLSKTMCCYPVVSDVPLPPDLVDDLTISDKERDALLTSDFGYMQKVKAEYLEFWQKQFRA